MAMKFDFILGLLEGNFLLLKSQTHPVVSDSKIINFVFTKDLNLKQSQLAIASKYAKFSS